MNTTALQTFIYERNAIRTFLRDGEPWFVAIDVCSVLDIKNATQAINRLDSDEVTMLNIGGLSGDVNIVNEPGLYTLILGSRKPEARAFKRWITHDVIPAIRKTGAYTAGTMSQLEIMRNMLDSQIQSEQRIARLESEVQGVIDKAEESDWCKWVNDILSVSAKANGRALNLYKGVLYKELEQTANCRLDSRRTRLQKRMRKSGSTFRDIQCLTKLEVIGADPRLKEVFNTIVRREACRAS